jgi:acylpyruvate hydrolase
MSLNEGDIIMTGTPSGVGPVIQGDHVEAYLKDGEKQLAYLELKVDKAN